MNHKQELPPIPTWRGITKQEKDILMHALVYGLKKEVNRVMSLSKSKRDQLLKKRPKFFYVVDVKLAPSKKEAAKRFRINAYGVNPLRSGQK